MSTTRTTKSIKASTSQSRFPEIAITGLEFSHLFTTGGKKTIAFDSLNAAPEWLASGRIQPSSSAIIASRLQDYKAQLTLVSSLRGYIAPSEYTVKNSYIRFLNIESQPYEYFEIQVGSVQRIIKGILDVERVDIQGVLPNGTTEVPLGRTVKIKPEELIVFRDGIQVFRDTENGDGSGNYYYLDPDNTGQSASIVFRDVANGSTQGPSLIDQVTATGEAIRVTSIGAIADNPTVSTFQQIEVLKGMLDKVVEYLVDAVAEDGDGIDAGTFNSPASSVDLRNFAGRVLTLENIVPTKQDKATKNRIQTKILSADVTTDGVVADLSFSNLTKGKWYAINGSLQVQDVFTINIIHGGAIIDQNINRTATSNTKTISTKFKAATTSVTTETFSMASPDILFGNNTRQESYLQIEELNGGEPEETLDFN